MDSLMARLAGASGKETAERARRAALSLFALHGYAAVSMRDIAGEVGVGAPALYNHFATKQDLLVELMEDHLRDLLGADRLLMGSDYPHAEGLAVPTDYVRELVGFSDEDVRKVMRENALGLSQPRPVSAS